MIIKKIEIEECGKISNYNAELKKGFNLFYGENESGKTTVYTMLKSMMKQIGKPRGWDMANDIFKNYAPWKDPGKYVGRASFIHDNKEYFVEHQGDGSRLFRETDGSEVELEENGIDYAQAISLLNDKRQRIDQEWKKALRENEEKREAVEIEAAYVWREIHKLEQRVDMLHDKIEDAIVEVEPEDGDDLDIQVTGRRWRIHPLEIISMIVAAILGFKMFKTPINYGVSVVVTLAGGLYCWNQLKDGRRRNKEEVILPLELAEEQETLDKMRWEQEHLLAELKEKQIMHSNLVEQLKEPLSIRQEMLEKRKQKTAVDMAIRKMEELSGEMQRELTTELNQKATEILREITDGIYQAVIVEEGPKITLVRRKDTVDIERVGKGTADQVYFALWMAASEILYGEEYPVLLDETFVFYDDKRLSKVLRWLSERGKQVLLFTCQNREARMLDELGIEYNMCDLTRM